MPKLKKGSWPAKVSSRIYWSNNWRWQWRRWRRLLLLKRLLLLRRLSLLSIPVALLLRLWSRVDSITICSNNEASSGSNRPCRSHVVPCHVPINDTKLGSTVRTNGRHTCLKQQTSSLAVTTRTNIITHKKNSGLTCICWKFCLIRRSIL